MKFRKKPVVIEAVRCCDAMSAATNAWKDLPPWLAEAYEKGDIVFGDRAVHVHTPEGVMVAQHNDWILHGVKGEIYPCKPDIFAATYEPVVEA